MAGHEEQNIWNMFYAFNEEYTLIPDNVMQDAGKSSHLYILLLLIQAAGDCSSSCSYQTRSPPTRSQ